jgi:hypothetical protein
VPLVLIINLHIPVFHGAKLHVPLVLIMKLLLPFSIFMKRTEKSVTSMSSIRT